jgi:cytochrome c553
MRQLYFLIFMLGLSNSGMTQPSPEKLALCASCHNSNGISKDNHWPNLAHQSQKYMSQQLKDYQSGQRVSAIMQAYAKLLSDKDIEQLSAYYASQPLPPAPLKRKSPNHQGLSLYKLGNYKQGIPACSACHGPKGLGNDPAKYPALALQNKAYLSQQLYAFKHKERKNDTAAIMQQISERLSEQDIKDVVDYIEDLS